MDDDTLTAIGELRKRVEELGDELDALKMEMKEESTRNVLVTRRAQLWPSIGRSTDFIRAVGPSQP